MKYFLINFDINSKRERERERERVKESKVFWISWLEREKKNDVHIYVRENKALEATFKTSILITRRKRREERGRKEGGQEGGKEEERGRREEEGGGRKEGGKKEERREERREGKEGGKEGRKGGRTIEDDRKRMKEIEREKNITPIKITSNPF